MYVYVNLSQRQVPSGRDKCKQTDVQDVWNSDQKNITFFIRTNLKQALLKYEFVLKTSELQPQQLNFLIMNDSYRMKITCLTITNTFALHIWIASSAAVAHLFDLLQPLFVGLQLGHEGLVFQPLAVEVPGLIISHVLSRQHLLADPK